MIATKTIMVLGLILSVVQAGNESFPFVNDTIDDLKAVALLDQRVFLSTENDDTNTYYSLTIRQQGAQDSVNMRLGLQWMRNFTDQEADQYRGVVFQIFTSFSSNQPIISIQNANNYFQYQQNGGTLSLDEFLDGMVKDEVGLGGATFQNEYIRNLKGKVVKNQDDIIVNINFTIADLDPIGDHRLWYRWVFYRNVPSEGDVIQGSTEPYFYGTYVNITDFFNTDWYLNVYYIMLALSMFWFFGYPFMWAFALYLQIQYLIDCVMAQANFFLYPGSENYAFNFWVTLIFGGVEICITTMIMQVINIFPFISPPVDFLVVLYMYISYQYQAQTTDYRVYYGTGQQEDGLLPVPQVIEHDAFFDTHFRSD